MPHPPPPTRSGDLQGGALTKLALQTIGTFDFGKVGGWVGGETAGGGRGGGT